MAHDEELAGRVRAVLPAAEAVTERLGGRMFCGVVKDTLIVRLGPDGAGRALDRPHVRPMDFNRRPMKGMVFVESGGLHGAALRYGVGAAAGYARGLPPKQATPPARERR